jgi:outer membrane protein TolC
VASQPLYAGGAITSGLSQLKAGYDIAQQSFLSTRQSTVQSVVAAYLTLAQAQESLKAAELNRGVLKTYLEITRQYAHIGRTRKMDELQASVNLSLADADVESLLSQIRIRHSALRKLLGEDDGAAVQVSSDGLLQKIAPLPFEEAYQQALVAHPDLKVATLKAEQLHYTRDLGLASDRPNLALVGTAGYQSPDRPNLLSENSRFYNLALNLTIPLFSGLSSKYKDAEYTEQIYQSEREVQGVQDTLRDQIGAALAQLNSADVRLTTAIRALKEAQEALELANRGYRSGTASSTDVVTMQTTRYNAEKLLILAEYDYQTAVLKLRATMGTDLEKAYAQ